MNPAFEPIRTPRLFIRPFAEGDVTDRYISWLNDPVTVRYSMQRHVTHTRETCRAYVVSMREKRDWFLAILREESPRHIGNISVAFDQPNLTADMAIVIGEPDARGMGYGFEAWLAVLDNLLGAAGIRKVTAGTMAANAPMLAVARKSQMIEEGRQRQQYLFHGEEVDRVLFARFGHPSFC
jgi:RimJ/RimL family protein N-acetyltransferase